MPTRRDFLKLAAVAGGVSVIGLPSLPSAFAASPSTLPLTFVNQTGLYANSTIWMYVVGTNAAGKQCYVRADGTQVVASTSLNGSDGYADLSIPFASSGNTRLNLPQMSGRIYFSINTKLKFRVVTDGNGNGAFQYPAGWVSSDPSYSVLHDCMEFTFNPSGMFCNTTMVDMFSIPLAINLIGSANQTTGTLKPGGRDAIFSALAAQSAFKPLIIGSNLRVIAPGHGIEAGLFSSTYYDAYINQVWSQYASTNLNVTINTTTYTGRVSGSQLVFNGGVAPFNKPTTKDVFYCNGALGAPNDGLTGPVAAQLGAAYNRSTLLSNPSQPVNDPSKYYLPATTNHYSQAIHQNTVDGKAYGFPFDDVGGFASYVSDGSPSAMTVTLTPFGSGGTVPSASLLSQGKSASASSTESTAYAASLAVDGNTGTRWSSAFGDPQWLSVDLGANHSVSRVVLNWEAAYGTAYQIQTSTNGTTWSTVYSTTTGDGGIDDLSFAAVQARYVRVYGTQRATTYGYSLWEFQVYGT